MTLRLKPLIKPRGRRSMPMPDEHAADCKRQRETARAFADRKRREDEEREAAELAAIDAVLRANREAAQR